MEPDRNTPPPVPPEGDPPQEQASRTILLGEALLNRVRTLAREIQERVNRVIDPSKHNDGRPSE